MSTSVQVGLVRGRVGVGAPHGLALSSTTQPTIEEEVQAFIASIMGEPFEWGRTDCASTADRWVRATVGFSPMACFGRIHSGEDEARAWLSEPGGIAVALNRVMRASGVKRTVMPVAGDIGLVVHDGRVSIAIHTGKLWFSRDETGFVGVPLTAHWKAWDIMTWAAR